MSEDFAISIKNVSKDFELPHERVDSVKTLFTQPFRRRKGTTTQHALKDISFDIKKGEFFGIVGRNGSGKSTLLKIIAGIYQPTKGSVKVNGRLVPFIELGVGFNPELTGRENVFLNGALMGFSQKEIMAKYESIVSFAELPQFMDQKLKNYSSGMQVRLAFSVATILAESDILLIDEVLAVGDADFQRKCFEYFGQLKRNKKTVVFVSHDMNAVREYCDRAIFIDQSKLVASGTADEIAKEYTRLFLPDKDVSSSKKEKDSKGGKWGAGGVDIVKLKTDKKKYTNDDTFVEVSYELKLTSKDIADESFMVGLSVKNRQGQIICGTNSKIINYKDAIRFSSRDQSIKVTWQIPNIFNEGSYVIEPAVDSVTSKQLIQWWDDAYEFSVINEHKTPYLVAPDFHLKVTK